MGYSDYLINEKIIKQFDLDFNDIINFRFNEKEIKEFFEKLKISKELFENLKINKNCIIIDSFSLDKDTCNLIDDSIDITSLDKDTYSLIDGIIDMISLNKDICSIIDGIINIIENIILDEDTPNKIKLYIISVCGQDIYSLCNLINEVYLDEKLFNHRFFNEYIYITSDFYNKLDEIFFKKYLYKWMNSDNNYLNCAAIVSLINYTYNYSNPKDIFSFENKLFSNIEINNGDINLIEFIARSINETYYKPIMCSIISFINTNMRKYKYNSKHMIPNSNKSNTLDRIIKSVYDLLYYNKESNNIYDVLIRACSYEIIKKYYPSKIDFIKNKVDFVMNDEFNHQYYLYIDENIFLTCSMNDYNIFKKLDNGGYLVPEYYVESVCFEKEWFNKHRQHDYISIDDNTMIPSFEKPISSDKFDLTFNSDPNLFDTLDHIIYYDRESAKKAFMKNGSYYAL